MPLLLIDTATAVPVLTTSDALNRNDWMPASGDVATRVTLGLEQMASIIDSSSIKGIVVGCGPGSYTGLRIGLTVAKAWGYARKLSLCGVSSLSILVPSQKEVTSMIASGISQPALVLDARGGGIYTSLGSKKLIDGQLDFLWAPPRLVSMVELAMFSRDCDAVLSIDILKLEVRWKGAGAKDVYWREMQPAGWGLLRASEKMGSWHTWQSLYRDLRPNYLRDAVP